MEADDPGRRASNEQSTRWGLSVLDWHAHAVNMGINHPIGVYVAYCGHLLMMVTELHNDPPTSALCPICIERSGR